MTNVAIKTMIIPAEHPDAELGNPEEFMLVRRGSNELPMAGSPKHYFLLSYLYKPSSPHVGKCPGTLNIVRFHQYEVNWIENER